MAITAIMGAGAGKVVFDEKLDRDLGGTGRNESFEHSWTLPRKCLVFAVTDVYGPTAYTLAFLRNGQTVEPKINVKTGQYSCGVAIFDAQKGDVITVRSDRGRNYQGIYLYAISK